LRPVIAFLTVALLSATAFADLTVTVKDAQTVVTVTPEIVTQLQTVDGDKIGQAVREVGPPEVKQPAPAAVVSLKSNRELAKSLVKIKCATADVLLVETGVYVVAKPGTHVLDVNVISESPLQWDDQTVTVVVGDVVPPDPKPPEPPPTPPGPMPGEAPIDGEGFRVLFVSESGDRVPSDVEDAFWSKEISDYLNANCIKVDGQPDFRRVDPDTKYTDPNHRFAKALARPRASLPWLIVSNGKTGYEGPFPGGKDATLALLKSLNVQSSATPPASDLDELTITVHTTTGCLPCHQFIQNELPKLKDLNIKVVEGGAAMFPTFRIQSGDRFVVLVGGMSADGLRFRIKELLK
jgi:hypothetical protein